jgi:hypothetical protein
LEKISLDLEEEKEGNAWYAEKNIKMKFGLRREIVCVIHRLADDI